MTVMDAHWLAAPLSRSVGASGSAAVGGLSLSTSTLVNTTAGIVVAVVGVAGLVIGISRSNRERRREYAEEIAAAEHRGAERYRSDMEFWRGIAVSHLVNQGMPIPSPPSLPDPPVPIRRRRRQDPDDVGET